jgi:hypothetical protein
VKFPFDRVPQVAKEMQHFLWSPERQVRDGYLSWWNCADHAVMTGALMWINGYDVNIFGGRAYFAQGPGSHGTTPCLHAVPRHWWITAKNIGVIDFSPDLSVGDTNWDARDFDYVFGNKVFADTEWNFEHTGRFETVQAQLASVQQRIGRYACIYFREKSKDFDPNLFLGEHLIANQNRQPWAQAALLYHLQKLLENQRDSLCSLSVNEAWTALQSVPKADIDTVTSRLSR